MPEKWERLSESLSLLTNDTHTFGCDAYLLADFAAPKPRTLCCDLGSGCGVIPMLWLARPAPPEAAYAVELQTDACFLLRRSAERAALGERLIVVNADLRALPDTLPLGRFELVACNPPYFAAGTGRPSAGEERRSARHEGAESCTLPDVCHAAARLLKYGGRLCLCHRPERLPDVMQAMREAGIEPKRLRFVQQRPEKAPWLFLIEGKRGGKPALTVLPPLIMAEADGRYTDEVYQIYAMQKPE